MAIKLQVKGVDTVLGKIKAYAKGKQNENRKEVARTAFAIQKDARQNVRVDTGRLRASINLELKDGGFDAEIGSNVNYAFAQEFGDPQRPRYSYTPYLNPAFLKNRQAFLNNIKTIMSK